MNALPPRETLASQAAGALACEDVDRKLDLVARAAHAVRCGELQVTTDFTAAAPETPGRPARPELVSPRALERRSAATPTGHAALIHAMAHIEFNAINLALDAVCRFPGLPTAFYTDWLGVGVEEARHFSLLREHLRSRGSDYGEFSAHDGLWQMALKTAHDPMARMALVPRVLEARGLDASPGIIRRLRANGDHSGAAIVEIILHDEVGHVAIGTRWFNHLCAERGLEPESTFARLLREYDAPRPVLPLNVEARRQAHFTPGELDLMHAMALSRSQPQAR
jgi:uncharacterized ferritin-like protein (DUF455 family)